MKFVLAYGLKTTAILILTIFLGACGGSNGESLPGMSIPVSGVDSGPAPEPTPVPEPTPEPVPEPINTGAATLNWIPPTEYTDGTVLDDLTGYKIYYGTSPDALDNIISISNPGLSAFVIENLSGNMTYYFAITAINSKGIESSFSNIASKDI
jgi:hypothetical protein